MSEDAWADIQALRSRKRKRENRKKERQDLLNIRLGVPTNSNAAQNSITLGIPGSENKNNGDDDSVKPGSDVVVALLPAKEIEDNVLKCLTDAAIHLPVDSRQIQDACSKTLQNSISHDQVLNLLEKFAFQQLITIKERISDEGIVVEVITAEHSKLLAMVTPYTKKLADDETVKDSFGDSINTDDKKQKDNDVLSLLSLASTREKENKRIGEEIRELLSRPSVKEKTLAEQFRSQGGTTVQEFCPHGTKSECRRVSPSNKPCSRLHFRKIIQSHTDETLGDCSFLNTCFHMETCKYVHYEVDTDKANANTSPAVAKPVVGIAPDGPARDTSASSSVLYPPQWIHCDLRFFDMTTLGKFSVIMADPPWDIHMELPYGTLSDDEMRQLNIPALQDEGLIFLWVTGRAMELGRECLQLWGYERVDELIWVKTNQLQRIIRTGRTGHWLNHGKEHCLVGMKGNPPINRGLDCDVIVAEVRATSHKPDEIYGIIERLSPGTRKIELFGRPHNIQPNWMTLGNQLDGIHLVDEELQARFYTRYPDGNCMAMPT